eukprot:6176748-Pleurochrysis_carterae.AAC.3
MNDDNFTRIVEIGGDNRSSNPLGAITSRSRRNGAFLVSGEPFLPDIVSRERASMIWTRTSCIPTSDATLNAFLFYLRPSAERRSGTTTPICAEGGSGAAQRSAAHCCAIPNVSEKSEATASAQITAQAVWLRGSSLQYLASPPSRNNCNRPLSWLFI